jgi:hypothetical protein
MVLGSPAMCHWRELGHVQIYLDYNRWPAVPGVQFPDTDGWVREVRRHWWWLAWQLMRKRRDSPGRWGGDGEEQRRGQMSVAFTLKLRSVEAEHDDLSRSMPVRTVLGMASRCDVDGHVCGDQVERTLKRGERLTCGPLPV